MADRDADLRPDRARRVPRAGRTDVTGARLPRSTCGKRPSLDAGSGCGAAAQSGSARAAGRAGSERSGADATTDGHVRNVLCRQHDVGSARLVLPLRVRSSALPGLPAAGDLVGRLLHTNQHWRRGHPETRLRRRSRQHVEGTAGDGAVRDHRRRQFPQQRRHRRQGAAASGRSEYHRRRRRHAAQAGVRRQRARTRGRSTSTGKNRRARH